MAKEKWRSEVRLTADVTHSEQRRQRERDPATAFLIVILGDWLGSAAAPAGEESARSVGERWVSVDIDNFDSVLAAFRPVWRGDLVAGPDADSIAAEVRFESLDDFHPDRIAARLTALRKLLDTRRALDDPGRCEKVAQEVAGWALATVETQARDPEANAPARPLSVATSGLLDQILEQEAPAVTSRRESSGDELQRFVAEILAPHVVKTDPHRQARLTAAVDEALSRQMRAVLHDPAFQALEAAWRGVARLVRCFGSNADVKIALLQHDKEDLAADLLKNPDSADTRLGRLLDEAADSSEQRPALLIGNYAFGGGVEDLRILECLGLIGRRIGAPFVAAASPGLLGCESFAALPSASQLGTYFEAADGQRWQALRQSAAAPYIGLAMPRILGRLPYGAEIDATQSFAFEEQEEPGERATLLWTNAALAVAEIVARAFVEQGWSFDLAGRVERVEDLPLYVYQEFGEASAMPCGEAPLSERVVEVLEEAGFIPVVSPRGGDFVAFSSIQALAVPRRPLRCG